jgi:hypothetical protein
VSKRKRESLSHWPLCCDGTGDAGKYFFKRCFDFHCKILNAWQGEEFALRFTGYENAIHLQQNNFTRAFCGAPVFFSVSRWACLSMQEPIPVEAL